MTHEQRGPDRSPLTSIVKDDASGCFVLNKEKMTVKFNKDVIITEKTINGEKMLADVWNMKDVTQLKR